MDISKITEILMVAAPTISTTLTTVGCFLFLLRKIVKLVKNKNSEVEESNKKVEKVGNDIATLKAKITSIEKHLLEKKEGK